MPPPPKPTTPPSAPLGGPADEADRLGREHSNKREMKMRQERVRALADEAPQARRGSPAVPAGAPVVQPRSAAPSGTSRIPDVDGPPPQRTPAAPRPAERESRPPQNEKNVVERPVQARGVVEKVIEPRPEPPSVIDDVGVEAEDFLREQRALWSRFSVADKISVVSAVLVLFGTLLPWLWRKNEEVVLGIGSGGVVHAVIAGYAIWLLFDRERTAPSWGDDRGMRPTPHQMKKKARRTALWMLLLALLSTFAGIWFIFVYGAIRRYEVPTVDVSVGLYLTLAAGLGLSYSGFAYFWRGGRE